MENIDKAVLHQPLSHIYMVGSQVCGALDLVPCGGLKGANS